jgi:hypothetical protein
MSAGIIKGIDKGIVGFTEQFGETWHRFKEYTMVNGAVPFDDVMKTLDYRVSKIPLALNIPAEMLSLFPEGTNGKNAITPPDPDNEKDKGSPLFALVREDSGAVIYRGAVLGDFVVYQNSDFLNEIHNGLLKAYPELEIESCGSLFGGRISFLNLIIGRMKVNKDVSETISRLSMSNAFGGKSIWSGLHNTRIVCANTERIAMAQAAANATLKKFSHTIGAPERVDKHMSDLSELKQIKDNHLSLMNSLVEIPMGLKDVDNFLGLLIPTTSDSSQIAVSRRENKRDVILEKFETLDDLQGDIFGTRYAMYQAVTHYTNHDTLNKGTDKASAEWEIITGGNRHKFNQKALDILSGGDIPDPKVEELVAAGISEN